MLSTVIPSSSVWKTKSETLWTVETVATWIEIMSNFSSQIFEPEKNCFSLVQSQLVISYFLILSVPAHLLPSANSTCSFSNISISVSHRA